MTAGTDDPATDALAAEVAAALQNGNSSLVGVSIPSMTMTDKDQEIKEINDLRAGYNAAVDKKITDNTATIALLTEKQTAENANIVSLNVRATLGEPGLLYGAIPLANATLVSINNGIANFQSQNDDLAARRIKVNNDVDQLILNIQSQYFVYNDAVIATYYTSDSYSSV